MDHAPLGRSLTTRSLVALFSLALPLMALAEPPASKEDPWIWLEVERDDAINVGRKDRRLHDVHMAQSHGSAQFDYQLANKELLTFIHLLFSGQIQLAHRCKMDCI